MKRNIVMRIAYDGTRYHGWQYQENGITVQEVIEKALSELFREKIRVTGCSRTDAGVHALDYILNFKAETGIPLERLPYALNYHLSGEDISALAAWEAEDSFNSRFSVKGKKYIYLIHNSRFRNPFYSRYSWHYPYTLSLEAMAEAAGYFEGTHDFRGFMASGGQQKTTVRTIRQCTAEKVGGDHDIIKVTVEADAFLYNMVRIITGTVLYAGSGKIPAADIPEIIGSGDRKRAGITAPPEGLFLKKVYL